MKYAIIVIRSLLGLIFVVFGANYFIGFLEMPAMEGPPAAFMGAMAATGYLAVVKVLEIVGGALTLSGRYTPLGLLILGPIIVNIALFDIFLAKAVSPPGLAVVLFGLFLLWAYRRNFLPILCAGGCRKSETAGTSHDHQHSGATETA